MLRIRDNNGPTCSHVIAILDRHLDYLQVRIKELTAMRNEVRGLRERASTADPANCSDDDICHVIPSQHIS